MGDLSHLLGLYAPSLGGQMILGDVGQQKTGCTGLYLVLSFFTSRLMFWAGLCRKKHHCRSLLVSKRNRLKGTGLLELQRSLAEDGKK